MRTRRPFFLRLAATGAVTAIALSACSSNQTGSSGVAGSIETPLASAPAESSSPSTEASASATANRTLVTFQEVNASTVFGGGVLSDLGDGSTAITLGVVAIDFKDPLTAEIIAGACADVASAAPSAAPSTAESAAASEAPGAGASPSPSTAPTPATLPVKLKDVSGGSSNTVVQIGLTDLLGSPSAIVLHKSAADPSVVACGDVTATPAVPSSLPTEVPSELPSVSTAP